MATPTAPACKHCKAGPETYYYYDLFEFDVDAARALTRDGRAPVEVDEESVRLSMDGLRLVPEHVDHVDPQFPGIIAHLRYHHPSGEVFRGHAIIDGNHRAARCLRDGLPYFAYLLSEEESDGVLVRRNDLPATTE